MRLIPWALLVCGLASTAAAATKEPPPGQLHSVAIKGNHYYDAAAIMQATGLKIGQHISGPQVEEARVKLQNTELFTNVSDEFRYTASTPPGYDVTFTLVENEQRFPMRFERLGLPPDEIQQYLRRHVDLYSDRIPGTEGVLHRYTQAVQECVAAKDPSLKVRAAVTNDDPQQLTIVFTPDKPVPTISQVLISGNSAVDTGTILRAVNQVAIGVPLSDTRLKMILDGAIKPVYAAKGYAAVSFPKIETEPSKSNLGVVVKVEIQEGPLFKFGAIRFHGQGLDEDEIRSAITFKPGQPYNGDQVTNFRIELQHRLKRHGLLDASVTAEPVPEDTKRLVDVVYNVVPGAVYNFQTLDIKGLDITTEPVIAKLWGEKPGHPFNPDYPDFFLKKVQDQGIFEHLGNTESDYTADSTSHNVTVHLYFKGGESAADKDKKKKEEEEKRKSDGTWSPYPQFNLSAR